MVNKLSPQAYDEYFCLVVQEVVSAAFFAHVSTCRKVGDIRCFNYNNYYRCFYLVSKDMKKKIAEAGLNLYNVFKTH